MTELMLFKNLCKVLGDEQVIFNEPMMRHTTFKIGGLADCLIMPQTVEEIVTCLQLCRESDTPLHIIGLGSDLLVSDAGLRGVVMKLADNFSQVYREESHSINGGNHPEKQACYIVAQAGASNSKVAHYAMEHGLSGYEFAAGIPGTVGGAAIMNAGAYGGEFCDVARSLTCVTPQGELVKIDAADANWGYRHSMMDKAGYVVISVSLSLRFSEQAKIQEYMDDLASRRKEKQPLEMPSAGSTFKRPEGYYAGKLIEDAGLRGYRVGGAQVSSKHCGFVVNAENASAADVRQIIKDIQAHVYETSEVLLEPEVRMWGFTE